MKKPASIQSQGGAARAAKLTPEQRKDIAARGASARWSKDLPKAIYQGKLSIGEVEIECAVLDNGVRVISQSSFLRAIGRSPTPSAGSGSAQFYKALEADGDAGTLDELPPFLPSKNLKPFISRELLRSTNPIAYKSLSGGVGGTTSFGYNAEILPMVCHVYEDAERANGLLKSQRHIADAARSLSRAFSKTGIIALVDEATGYQYDRARDALAKILEKFIAKELQPWTRTFPLEFYQEIFRLKQWPFDPATMQGPRVLGRYTNNIIYERLAPDVLKNLREKNPVVDGRRKHKHFQWLTGEVGHPKLLAHLEGVKMLMKVSSSWEEFRERLDKFYPVLTVTELGLEVAVSKKPTGKIIDAFE